MDVIKEAFDKVKQDIILLKQDIKLINYEISEIQNSILNLFKNYSQINQSISSTEIPTYISSNSTIRQVNPTENLTSTHSSTHNLEFKDLKNQDLNNSTGNNGVSTDRQTDRQTDTSTGNKGVKPSESSYNIEKTSNLINELDNIKKELKLKIKSLTKQEMLVLSSIYQFEDQGQIIDYNLLSQNLSLTESSIRDYIQRIINKGLPLSKEKINNKRVVLSISKDLRKLASLNTLLTLRNM
jgi:hypothetical protein